VTTLVDTSVWSLALRRRPSDLNRRERRVVDNLRRLIEDGDAAIIGPIRQELLSGVRDEPQFHRLRETLGHFPHIIIEDADYDAAAECFNTCRSAGLAATAIDMLICAVAMRVETRLFSIDADFERYAKVVDLELHKVA